MLCNSGTFKFCITLEFLPHWMAAHARLKNEFTEDEKYHNLMRWLKYFLNMRLEIIVPCIFGVAAHLRTFFQNYSTIGHLF